MRDQANSQSTDLDKWIDRHLLQCGPDLLIDEESRRAMLARQRDSSRRETHAAAGKQSARVEMSIEAWKSLEIIQAYFTSDSGKEITRSQTLQRLITDYLPTISGAKTGHGRKGSPSDRAPKRSPDKNRDLFG